MDVAAPTVAPLAGLAGPPVPPEARIHFYSPDEWERFVLEWVVGLQDDYIQIKGLGGSGDRGVDIAGFLTDHGFRGAWDCYQAKHYANALTPSDAMPEMLKLFRHAALGHYDFPRRYFFVAPRGCGMTLNRLLSDPHEMQKHFLASIGLGKTLVDGVPQDQLAQIRNLAAATDFAVFRSVETHELLAVHRRTPFHASRFGGPLPERGPIGRPPDEPDDDETVYIAKLADAYREDDDTCCPHPDDMASCSRHGGHFLRQRISFYSAEALRLYARDSVPEGTFAALQKDIFDGVVELAEAPHPNGLARLASVLSQSVAINLTHHPLISVSQTDDRKGVCHQLANEDRLTWASEGP